MKRKFKIYQLILFVGLASLLGGCGGLDIEQEISTSHDYDNCIKQYTIRTVIHNRNWEGRSKECIYLQYRWDVKAKNRDSIAYIEYRKAELFKKRAEDCFGDDL